MNYVQIGRILKISARRVGEILRLLRSVGMTDNQTEAVTDEILSGPVVVPDLLTSIDDQIAGKLPAPDGETLSKRTAGECAEQQGIV